MRPQTKASPAPPSSRTTDIGLGFLGVALALSALVWAAAHLAALITDRPVRVSIGDAGGLLVRWGMDPFVDGATAPEPGAVLPASPGVIQVVAVLLGLALAGLAVGGWLLRGRGHLPGKQPRHHDAARWGTRSDLRSILVRPGDQRDRLVLGELTGTIGRRLLVAVEELHSVFVLGPTQSRKTSALAIPALLEWQGPAIVTSVKRDLFDATCHARWREGEVWVFDPGGYLGELGASWDPLGSVACWDDARELAKWLTEAAAEHKELGDAHKGFFDLRAQRPLAAAIWAAVIDGKDLGQVRRWIDALGERPPKAGPGEVDVARYSDAAEAILDVLAMAGEVDAILALKSVMDETPNQRSGTITSAQAALDVFSDSSVERACSRVPLSGGQIVPDRLLDGNGTLYLYAPLHEQTRLRPVFEALIQAVVRTAMERTARTGRPLDNRLLVLLDEAGNIAPLENLAQIASSGAGQAIQLLTIFQDGAQLVHRYGKLAATVINNHRAKLMLSGLTDPDSLELISRLIGDAAEAETSTTTGEDRTSTTEHISYRRLAPPALLRGIRPGWGVLIYGHLPAAKVRLRWWLADRDLLALAGTDQERRAASGQHSGNSVRGEAGIVHLGGRRRRRRAA